MSPTEVIDNLGLSKSTACDYVDRLVDLSLIERDNPTRTQQLTAEPVILVKPYTPITITPTVLHGLALQEVDEDIEYFLDRYGTAKLVVALSGSKWNSH